LKLCVACRLALKEPWPPRFFIKLNLSLRLGSL